MKLLPPKHVCRLSKSRLTLSAFTLTELLVVVTMLGVLAAILVSALGRGQFSDLVTNCTSNYRQWGVLADVYAADNLQYLPGTDMQAIAGAGNVWDVNANFVPAMFNYGSTVQRWFCPARPGEIAGAASYNNNKPIVTLTDLTNYMVNFVGGSPGVAIMNHNLWTSRKAQGNSVSFPYSQIGYTQPDSEAAQPNVGWPSKTTDRASQLIPFLSDSCFSGYGTLANRSTATINVTGANNFIKADKYSGHVYGGRLINVNLAFADGHVGQHPLSQIQCVYENLNGPSCWFY